MDRKVVAASSGLSAAQAVAPGQDAYGVDEEKVFGLLLWLSEHALPFRKRASDSPLLPVAVWPKAVRKLLRPIVKGDAVSGREWLDEFVP